MFLVQYTLEITNRFQILESKKKEIVFVSMLPVAMLVIPPWTIRNWKVNTK